MIAVCPQCSSQIQIGGTKAASGPLTIRCPKCSTTFSYGTSPASEKSALTLGASPSTKQQHRFEVTAPAPLFKLEGTGTAEASNLTSIDEIGRLLANLLAQSGANRHTAPNSRPAWNPRKALVCTTEPYRESIARQLAQNAYQVFVAEDTGQAVDRMRENQLDVVLLDPEFDSAEQGAAFVAREVNVLRPAQRRRLFFVLLSPVLRTMEAHAAFLHNVNAIVNFKELQDLSTILEHALREYNELYKELNLALNLPAL